MSRRMCVKLLVEHCYNRSPKKKIIKMQRRILKSWALGQSSIRGNRDGDEASCCCNHLVKGREKRILSVFA
jgi:hypothetical protein